jgi:TonB family protein
VALNGCFCLLRNPADLKFQPWAISAAARPRASLWPIMLCGSIPCVIRIESALTLTMLFPLLLPAQASSPKTITAAEADSHIVKRIEPTVPPLAKLARIGGKVELRIAISPSGDVSTVKAISGHPLLVQSAIEAAKKWKYRPLVEDGKPVAVETDVELDFPGGMGEPERAVRNRF